MNIVQDTYPVFEANQVLTNRHLNDVFAYLDEQERLTRANLVGVGIVCGLELERGADEVVQVSAGCGVTSQGYLVIEPEDVVLKFYRDYTLPDDVEYPTLQDDDAAAPGTQYPLWELLPAAEPGSKPLAGDSTFLDDKAGLLFLELNREGIENCSPASCDARGAEVAVTVRRLLIRATDLSKVVARSLGLSDAVTATDLQGEIQKHLNLDELRIPRYDVPNSGRFSSEQVLEGFQSPFKSERFSAQTAKALDALYAAFRPLLQAVYPDNPFARFSDAFGFLDDVPKTSTQVRFLQYYWDLFDDLSAAYDEIRSKGTDLLCLCNPPASLFPRHLGLGLLASDADTSSTAFRHTFLPSPAIGGCRDRADEFLVLFRRLVSMVEAFTDNPLPQAERGKEDRQVRITPSKWGLSPLSLRAIPYYFRQQGSAPLYGDWNPDFSRRNRANHNLSYRSDEFLPAAPSFVTEPLRFDLEPNNFLRVEGHLGKNVQVALSTLLALKSRYRLPIEVVALRTGDFDENAPIELDKEDCRFADLDSLYRALRAELICSLGKAATYFYSLPFEFDSNQKVTRARLPLLQQWDPEFEVRPDTLGRFIEDALLPESPRVRTRAGAVIGLRRFGGDPVDISADLVLAMSLLASELTDEVQPLSLEELNRQHDVLTDRAEHLGQVWATLPPERRPFPADRLGERLDDLLRNCRVEAFRVLVEEYRRRVRQAKQRLYLSDFLREHPGIQHKAGVPLGGTFILVYHSEPEGVDVPDLGERDAVLVREPALTFSGADVVLRRSLARLQGKKEIVEDPDFQALFVELTGRRPVPGPLPDRGQANIYAEAVAEIADGTVIADFFLPYICCSNCSPIHFELPPARLGLEIDIDCTNEAGVAEATLKPSGASGAVSYQVDGGAFQALAGKVALAAGRHTLRIRDEAGTESPPAEVAIPGHLTFGPEEFEVDAAAGTYRVSVQIRGGTPPYQASSGSIEGDRYTSPPVPRGQAHTAKVADAAGCVAEKAFAHAGCDLPCEGVALRCGYRFWLPEPAREHTEYKVEVGKFAFVDPAGAEVDLTDVAQEILNSGPRPLPRDQFQDLVRSWLEKLNEIIKDRVGSGDWMRLEYEPPTRGFSTGTLWIDRLVCLDFTFNIGLTLARPGADVLVLEATHSKEGTVLFAPREDARMDIPPFDCSESNKCKPEQAPVPRCKDVDMRLSIKKEVTGRGVATFTAVAAGNTRPVAFAWDVQDGSPPFASGETASFRFQPLEPPTKTVRLVAFTEEGCSVTLVNRINVLEQ